MGGVVRRVSARLRQARLDAGLSQESMGELLGMTQEGWGSLERGRTAISVEQLMRVCEVLQLPVTYFIGGVVEVSGLDAVTAEIAGIVAGLPERERVMVLAYARFIAQEAEDGAQ